MYTDEHIDYILNEIGDIWKKHPTATLGGLISKAVGSGGIPFIEDEDLIKELEEEYIPKKEWKLKWSWETEEN